MMRFKRCGICVCVWITLVGIGPNSSVAADPPGGTSGWTTAFDDEFNTSSLDTSKWTVTDDGSTVTASPLTVSKAANVTVGSGFMQVAARSAPDANGHKYTSAQMNTAGKFVFQYGYMETRMKIPTGYYAWPAFWMLQSNNAWPPEIDVLEFNGDGHYPNVYYSTYHYYNTAGSAVQDQFKVWNPSGASWGSDYHVYGADWEPGKISFYVDDVFQFSTTNQVSNQPMYLLYDLAMGGTWPGVPDGRETLPSYLNVDWVKVWAGPNTITQSSPYSSTPVPIPATGTAKLEAENYDLGGDGIAYHSNTTNNKGGKYRTDGVSIVTCTDTGGGYDVTGTAAGNWMKYTVNVAQAGTYDAAFRVASPWGSGMFHLENATGTHLTGPVSVPQTWGDQTWTTVTVHGVNLAGGLNTLRLVEEASGFDINFLTFTLASAASSLPNGTYKIFNRNSGKALDVYNQGTANGANVDVWSYVTQANQQWQVTSLGSGLYKIIGVGSGRALEVHNQGTGNGSNVDIWDYVGQSNEQWRITATDSGYYKVLGAQSGRALEVNNALLTNGANVDIWDDLGQANEQWSFQAAP